MSKLEAEIAEATELHHDEIGRRIDADPNCLEYPGMNDDPVPPRGRRARQSARVDRAAWQDEPTRLAPHEAIQRAHQVLDIIDNRDTVPAEGLERIDTLLRSPLGADVGRASAWALVASDPAYESAFIKMLADPQRGHLGWTDVERVAHQRAETVRRAMSVGTDTTGGFMAPLILDPTILLTSNGSVNPLRQVARVVTTTSNWWNGVTSAGVTASWDAEAAEVSDDAPTLAQPSIDVHKGAAFVPFSIELEGDGVDLYSELQRLLVDSIDQLQALAHVTGTGTGEPQGFVTGLDGTASELSPVTTEAFAAADVYDTIEAVPPRFRANASWLANLGTMNDVAQFETANGARLFPSIDDGRLLMKTMRETSNMASSGDINAAATADHFIVAVGDWKQGYVLVDRIGTTIELIPHLVGSNQRPTGQRGLYCWFRHGAEVVNTNALRILNVATTA